MHPVILQAFAAERIRDIPAAVDTVQRARQARRARQHGNRGLIWARPAVRRAAVIWTGHERSAVSGYAPASPPGPRSTTADRAGRRFGPTAWGVVAVSTWEAGAGDRPGRRRPPRPAAAAGAPADHGGAGAAAFRSAGAAAPAEPEFFEMLVSERWR